MTDEPADPRALLRLKQAVEGAGDVVLLTDRHGIITFINAKFTDLYGYRAAEVVGRSTPRILKSAVHPPDEHERFWQRLLQGHMVTGEFTNRTKDGRLVTVHSSANAIVDGHEIVGFFAVQRDVTERRAAAEHRRLAEFALDHNPDAIFWIQQDGRIRYANETAARWLGYSRHELCAMTVADIDPDTAPKTLVERFRLGHNGGSTTFESRARKRDGTVVPVEVAVTFVNLDGQQCGCSVVRDLTERHRLDGHYRHAQKMEAMGRLAGGIAHDFNNLLTAILGYSELALDRCRENPILARDLEQIHKAGECASRLTRQLLAFTRQQALAPQVVDLNDLVRGVIPMLARIIGEDLKLTVATGSAAGRAHVDPGQIEQVLTNLVVNARDALPKGGAITIATTDVEFEAEFVRHNAGAVEGPYVALRVTDNGRGMPPDVIAHAFEPFFTTKPPGKGTGLGLSTVHGIVKQSGGYVTIDSQLGHGTTVTVYFPRVDAPLPPLVAARQHASTAAATETILLVEDERTIRELSRRILERQGYAVLLAQDGIDALAIEASHSSPIHLLLTDIVMPGLSGPDLAQRLVHRRPTMKVLYMSGFARLPLAFETMNERTGFLQKPFTPETLSSKIRATLATHLVGRDSTAERP